jgi:hypothetical protein
VLVEGAVQPEYVHCVPTLHDCLGTPHVEVVPDIVFKHVLHEKPVVRL